MVLAMECSEEDMRARLLERGKTSGRADDNAEMIVKRFRTFVEQSQPVIEHFKARRCWHTPSVAASVADASRISSACPLHPPNGLRFESKVKQADSKAGCTLQKKGKCEVIHSVGTPDEVFVHVMAAVHKHLPHLPEDGGSLVAATPAHAAAAAEPATAPSGKTAPKGDAPVATTEEPKAAAKDAPVATSPASDGKLPEGSKIVFVLGGPGSGKGTQCDKIKAAYAGVCHLSAGDLLRDAVRGGNAELEAIMREGKLVPMETTIGAPRQRAPSSNAAVACCVVS
jgi:adenylate kinase family enzyme